MGVNNANQIKGDILEAEVVKLSNYECFRDRVCYSIRKIVFEIVDKRLDRGMTREEVDTMIDDAVSAVQRVFPTLERTSAVAHVSDIIFNNFEFSNEAADEI